MPKAKSTMIERMLVVVLAILMACPIEAAAAKLQPEGVKAWEQYLKWADQKVQRELSAQNIFLIQNTLPPKERAEAADQLKAGKVVIRKMKGIVPQGRSFDVPDGAVHHWFGSILVPNITLAQLLMFVKDYDNHAGRFVEVEKSKLLSKKGETYKFYFRLRRAKAPITVYYNTEQECTYVMHGAARASSRSFASKIAELESPGTPQEREKSHDDDWGFLWRVVTWWRFEETKDGVVVECESASLSRSVPGFIRFIPGLTGYLESVPRESLENTLTSIREFAKTFK